MREVAVLGLIDLALFLGLAVYLWPLEPGVLRLQLAFTPQAFGEIVHTWPAEHLARYRAHLPIDGALLVGYGLFGGLLARRSARLAQAGAWSRRIATWAWPMAAGFDAAENLLHAWLTELPRFGVPQVYAVAAGCASLKWTLLLLGVLVWLAVWHRSLRGQPD